MILGTHTKIQVNLFMDGNKTEKSQEVETKTPCNAFISSQFFDVPLIWMFSG